MKLAKIYNVVQRFEEESPVIHTAYSRKEAETKLLAILGKSLLNELTEGASGVDARDNRTIGDVFKGVFVMRDEKTNNITFANLAEMVLEIQEQSIDMERINY